MMRHISKWPALLLAGTLTFSPVFFGNAPAAQANQKVFRKVTADDIALAKRCLARADEARAAGQYEDAVSLYTKGIHLDERLGGYAGRGYCFLKLGNYAQAKRDAETAIANRTAKDLMKPGMNGLAEYVRAVSAYHLGDFQTAVKGINAVMASPYAKEADFRAILGDVAIKAQLAKREALRKSVEKERTAAEDAYRAALRDKTVPPVYDISSGFSWDMTAVTQEYLNGYEKLFAGRPANELNRYVYAMIPEGGEKSIDFTLFVPRHIHMTGLDGREWNEDNIVMLRVARATFTMDASGRYILHMLPETPVVTRSYIDKSGMPDDEIDDYVDFKTNPAEWKWKEENDREHRQIANHKVDAIANHYHMTRISDDASYFLLECIDGYEEDIGKAYKLIQLDNIPVPDYPDE